MIEGPHATIGRVCFALCSALLLLPAYVGAEPVVTATVPVNATCDVPLDMDVTVQFSTNMMASTESGRGK